MPIDNGVPCVVEAVPFLGGAVGVIDRRPVGLEQLQTQGVSINPPCCSDVNSFSHVTCLDDRDSGSDEVVVADIVRLDSHVSCQILSVRDEVINE